MKKTVSLLSALVLLVTLLLGGCKAQEETALPDGEIVLSNDVYTIVKQGDQFAMRVTNESVLKLAEDLQVYYAPTYRTLEAMRTAIRECKFTESDYKAISYQARRYDGEIPLFDLDRLYEPAFDTRQKYRSVSWDGATYYFEYENEYFTGVFRVFDKEGFERSLKDNFYDFINDEDREWVKTEEDTKRGGTMYYDQTRALNKTYILTLTQDSKTVYVRESYASVYDDEPYWINIWGTDGDNYFHMLIGDYQYLPTVSWYLSFGLTPYEGETSNP